MRVCRLATSLLLFGCGSAAAERPVGNELARFEEAAPREEAYVDLAVPDHAPAVVSVPPPTTQRHPLLVVAHGAWDRPEPHCALWRRLVGERAFVLCLRGQRTMRSVPHDRAAYYYPDHLALAREALAAIPALAARYPEQLDPSAVVWAGFSQGAIHGALVITEHADVFPRAVLLEGGNGFFDEWSPFGARRFARKGGQRVLFGCGSAACVRTAARSAGYLDQAGVATRVAHAEGAGHSYGPKMESQLREDFAWVVAGDPRWSLEPR